MITKMTATKMLTYDNRRMVPGEDFEAKSHRDLKVLLATRKAKVKREEVEVPPPPPEVAKRIVEVTGTQEPAANVTATDTQEIPPHVETTDLRPADPPPSAAAGDVGGEDEDIVSVRAEYREKMGRQPFNGWDIATLREKMS